jgi:hypothetical protein
MGLSPGFDGFPVCLFHQHDQKILAQEQHANKTKGILFTS